jgi:hypothetical protein
VCVERPNASTAFNSRETKHSERPNTSTPSMSAVHTCTSVSTASELKRMDNDKVFVILKEYLDNLGEQKIVLLWHGDYKQDGSFTEAIAKMKTLRPNDILLMPVRGTHPNHHKAFYESWKGFDLSMIEVSDEMRAESLEKVTKLCPNLPKPDDIKHGALVHDNAGCDFVLCIGGGQTTAGEMEYCIASKSDLKWDVTFLSRKDAKGGEEKWHENVEKFAPFLQKCESKKRKVDSASHA